MIAQRLGNSGPSVSRVGYGCMEIGEQAESSEITDAELRKVNAAVDTAVEMGITLFDHADIYGNGRSEELFGRVISSRPSLRDAIVLQSKCGIRVVDPLEPSRPEYYDFSCDYILNSVNGILRRLSTQYLDVLILHRPDALVEPEEVAEAFYRLHLAGKVRYFGVSNHNAAQIRFLRQYVDFPLVVNQVEFSLLHADLVDEGITFNDAQRPAAPKGDGTLEYCRAESITLQAWSPLAGGRLANLSHSEVGDSRSAVQRQLAELSYACQVSPAAMALAWILRHPANIQPIVGTTKPDRIRDLCQAVDVSVERWQWYSLLVAARGNVLP